MGKYTLVEMIPLTERNLHQLMHKTDVSLKTLRRMLEANKREGAVGVFTISDRVWPRTRY